MTGSETSPHGSGGKEFFLLVLFLGLVWVIGRHFSIDEAALRWPFVSLPLAPGGGAFILLYVVVTFFLWFSKDLLRLAAALVFGPLVSTALVWAAELGNCALLFFFSRRMGRRFMESSLSAPWQRLYAGTCRLGFGWLMLLKCAPVVPFRFLDLAAGLSPVAFGKYFGASAIGSVPRIFLVQLVLAGAGTAALKGPEAIASYFNGHPSVLLFGVGYIVFMIIASILVNKRSAHADND